MRLRRLKLPRAVQAALCLALFASVAFAGTGCGGSGTSATATSVDSSTSGADGGAPAPQPPPTHLTVEQLRRGLPAPISGEALSSSSGRLLVIGGLDASGTSTGGVVDLDPTTGRTSDWGTLSEPLHDLAAAPIGGRTLVFGGGSAATVDTSQQLVDGGAGQPIGTLPNPASDLSALAVGNRAYLLGGYDGSSALGEVLETGDGKSFRTVAELKEPVRYTAVAELGGVIYAFGGEHSDGSDTRAIQAVDLESGRASKVGELPVTLAHASAVALDGSIFVLGGREDGTPGRDILRFDPASGRALPAGRLPAALTNSAAASVSGSGYLVGGLDVSSSAVSSVLRLSPAP